MEGEPELYTLRPRQPLCLRGMQKGDSSSYMS